MTEYQFDDIDGLTAAISPDFGDWGPEIEVTQDMINGFAELTGDRQWIHIDVERAKKESPFGGPIAHGFLTLALVPKLNPASVHIWSRQRHQLRVRGTALSHACALGLEDPRP